MFLLSSSITSFWEFCMYFQGPLWPSDCFVDSPFCSESICSFNCSSSFSFSLLKTNLFIPLTVSTRPNIVAYIINYIKMKNTFYFVLCWLFKWSCSNSFIYLNINRLKQCASARAYIISIHARTNRFAKSLDKLIISVIF